MKTLRIILAGLLTLASVAPSAAFDRVLPSPRIKDNGDVRLSDDVLIGKTLNGVFKPMGDGSLLSNVPAIAAIPDVTGATAVNTAISTAISAAVAANRTEVILPAGTLMIDNNVGSIVMPSNLRIRGAGKGKTTIICNDAVSQTTSCLSTAPGSSNVHLSDLTVKGLGDSGHYSAAAAPVRFQGCTDCSVSGVEVRYARFISIFVTDCDRFSATDNFIYRSMLDGIHITDTPNAIISRNILVGVNDDAIAAHTYDTHAAPVRSGLVITDNVISESHGIQIGRAHV